MKSRNDSILITVYDENVSGIDATVTEKDGDRDWHIKVRTSHSDEPIFGGGEFYFRYIFEGKSITSDRDYPSARYCFMMALIDIRIKLENEQI
jgi:hypothetical protein